MRKWVAVVLALVVVLGIGGFLVYREMVMSAPTQAAAEHTAQEFTSALKGKDMSKLRSLSDSGGKPPSDAVLRATIDKAGGAGASLVSGSVELPVHGRGHFTTKRGSSEHRFYQSWDDKKETFVVTLSPTS